VPIRPALIRFIQTAIIGATFMGARAQDAPPSINPRVAFDVNPDPDIVEIFLAAEESEVDYGVGEGTSVYTFDGGVPGPTIEAEVGNTVIVHFQNLLPEPTTVHWHGVEVPASMDGSNISQNPVQPGGYFRYEFRVRRAATFWYHPHIRTNVQVEKGLYGALVVRDPLESDRLGLPIEDHVLVLDDILLDDQGAVVDPFPTDPLERANTELNGREGNILLVNGQPGRTLAVERGVPQRLRLINSSNVRFMRVSVAGHRMWRVGGDGGLLESPLEIPPIEQEPEPDRSKGLILTPGERADVVFTPSGSDPIALRWHDTDRGRHETFYTPDNTIGIGHADDDGERPSEVLMTFQPVGDADGTEFIPPSELRDIPPIDVAGAPVIPVMFGHTPPNAAGDVTFFAQMKNGMPLPFDMVTPEDAPTVNVGDTRIIEVNNMTGGDHNFHLHGFTFQHIETVHMDMDNPDNNRTVPAAYPEWKDTILLPARPGAMGRSRTVTRLAVRFTDTGREGLATAFGKVPGAGVSGGWVFHCHLLEHSSRGMMSFVQVRSDIGTTASIAPELPTEALLSQNFPNPFSVSTTIRFTVPEPQTVRLRVFNMLGQEVARLTDSIFEPGEHELTWEPDDVREGVYVYSLEIGATRRTKTLVIQ
jgi:FtsP/CotA-like multicopper oxidase with cupredoxin domain